MKNQVLLGLILLISCACVVQPAAIDPYEGVNFYDVYHNPEPQISLKARRTTAQRIASHGYPAEHHYIETEDGYIVGAFRIPYSHKLQNQDAYRPVVVIQHGLLSCSDAWVLCGPNDGLPYLLSDYGFDVWLGNGRGNTYSRNHTSRSTEHPNFWRFSWHEIGNYDIAAVIDYALAANGQNQKSIHYVGHSQGTTVFFALMSSRPEYNAKIKTAHMLAPVAFMNNLDNSLVRALGPYLGYYNGYSRMFSSQEFIPYNDFLIALLFNTCEPASPLHPICVTATGNAGYGNRSNMTALPEGLSTHPAGVSTDQMLHYLQEQQSAHFRLFDFGTKKNLKVYGTEQPPDYPVWDITSEVHLWYSDNDELAAVEDVLRLADLLPNKIMHHMDDPLWDHVDFALNLEIKKYINEPIIAIMQQYEAANSQL